MNLYLVLKHLHVTCVVLSGTGFFLRGLLMLADSPLLQRRWLKVLPHINDSLLLAAAVLLAAMLGQYPFVDSWLTAKVFGLVGYIIAGSLALKPGRSKAVRVTSWLLALALFAYIVSVALTHNPAGFLAGATAFGG